jgi:uncharacterized membrane protein
MTSKSPLILADETLSILRPISSVFGFLSDHENYIRWYPGVVSVTSVDRLPVGTIGKLYRETLQLPSGRQRDFDIKVIESRKPEVFITEGTLAPIFPRMEIRLTAVSTDETVLRLRFLSRSQSALGRLMIRTLVRRAVQRQTRRGLAKLKRLLERAQN